LTLLALELHTIATEIWQMGDQ